MPVGAFVFGTCRPGVTKVPLTTNGGRPDLHIYVLSSLPDSLSRIRIPGTRPYLHPCLGGVHAAGFLYRICTGVEARALKQVVPTVALGKDLQKTWRAF